MTLVRVTVTGDRELIRDLDQMGEAVRDLRQPFNEWGEELAESTRIAFATGGKNLSPAGWAPLSPAYAAAKIARGGGTLILVDTGRLRSGVAYRPMDIDAVGHSVATFGTDVEYAKYHQRGTRHMPARPFMVVTPTLSSLLEVMLQQHITEDW